MLSACKVHSQSELGTYTASSMEHLLIKSTVTANLNFHTGMSGVPEFWLYTSSAHVSSEWTRSLLEKQSISTPLH